MREIRKTVCNRDCPDACAWEATAAAQQRAIGYAQTAGIRRQEARMSGAYSMALCAGPTPVPEAIARCGTDQAAAQPVLRVKVGGLSSPSEAALAFTEQPRGVF